VLFSPKHPILKPKYDELLQYYTSLGLDNLISKAVEHAEKKTVRFYDALREYGFEVPERGL